jgi:hypothetical protein
MARLALNLADVEVTGTDFPAGAQRQGIGHAHADGAHRQHHTQGHHQLRMPAGGAERTRAL